MYLTALGNANAEEIKFTSKARYWDKAGTVDGGCYTVGVQIGLSEDKQFWILDVVRFQEESAKRERIIRETAERDSRAIPIGIEEEPGSGGKESAQNTVRNLAGWKVIRDKPSGSKELRADPFSTQVNAGNVYLHEAEWNHAYIEELKHFPFSRYKDQVDATSGGFQMLVKTKKRIGAMK